jgi:DNA gyrase inhibitor GyrI
MTDTNRIARLEYTVGTLITWLNSTLGSEAAQKLLTALHDEDAANIPEFFRADTTGTVSEVTSVAPDGEKKP